MNQVQPAEAEEVDTEDAEAKADIGQMLRGAYRQTVEEAIPDDLMDLLNRLE